jgi:cobalt-zinc-cadmium resistance protein CzcA
MRTDTSLPETRTLLERVLRFSVAHRWAVVVVTAAVAGVGLFNLRRLPIDAVPDITNVQVQVNTIVEGLPPLEIERQVTFPIETAMAGLPGLAETRSLSRYGLSQVTVVFRDGTNIYFARQLVNERLQDARESLPLGIAEPRMGPIATGLGEIFHWELEARPSARKADGTAYTATDLREIQDWIIKPQIRTVPGVTEVNTIGGFRRQYDVQPDPARLRAYGLTLDDILLALEHNNQAVGAGFLPRKGEQYLVHTDGRLSSPADIDQVVVATRSGVPIHVSDVATVGLGQELRTGAATTRGSETVIGTAIMLFGENSRLVAKRVGDRLKEVNRSLPSGIVARPVYDRTRLVDATLETVRKNLLEGAILVIAVLFALFGNWVAALIVALVIPLSMLFAVTGMVEWRVSANLLSLGAIDFGIIVDGAVVMVENILRRLSQRQQEAGRVLTLPERLHECYSSAREVARPTLFGTAIILIVYLPILTLTGVEGKMFRPLAEVVLLALTSALLLAFTFVPAMTALLLRGRLAESESPVVRRARHAYVPVLRWALAHRVAVLTGTGALLALCTVLATRLGGEFVPTLDEQDILIQPVRMPGISVDQAVLMQHRVEAVIATMPEVREVFARLGTAEVANDPMPISTGDTYVILKPRRQWPDPRRPKSEVVEEMESRLSVLPGNAYEFTQPIQMRFNELIAGVRSDVAIKVFGDDLDTMLTTASRIARIIRAVPGATDVKVEQVTGLPTLAIDIDRRAVARYGLDLADVQNVVRTALSGTQAGELFTGDRRFPIVVRLPEQARHDVAALELLPIPVAGHRPGGSGAPGETRIEFVPLSTVAHIRLEEGPNQVSRENGKRRVVVQANVRGRDLASFVAEARQGINANVALPAGYWLGWGGQFENLVAARTRLAFVVPMALALILALLMLAFGSLRDALVVFSGVPLALTGGVLALATRHMPFSITAGIGFIALSGVAVLNGLVLLSFVRQRVADGLNVELAIIDGCTRRLRPILMTALVAALGFVPMAIATGTGAEVQRPLATVVIGGIISSTLLTLLVLPTLYALTHLKRQQVTSKPHEPGMA